jgi:hypothetical protein
MATSYANPGGSGNRTPTLVQVTVTGAPAIGLNTVLSAAVDGNTSTNAFFFGLGSAYIVEFWFASIKIIDEAKMYQSAATTHGTWKWQGSNDRTTWTDIGSTFTLGGVTTQTMTSLAGNTTGYIFYRLFQVTGPASGTPWIYEFEFKIDEGGTTSYTHALGSGNRTGTITTAIGGGLTWGAGSAAHLINGSLANEAFWSAGGAAGGWMSFDLGASYLVQEARVFISAAVSDQGSWKFQGSTNNSTWIDLSGTVVLGAAVAAPGSLTYFGGFATNATDYRYYRLLGVSGTRTTNPFELEVEFMVGPPAPPPPPLSPNQTRVLADGASAYWPLDDPNGSTAARDLAGTRHAPIAGPVTVNQPGIGSSRAMTFAVPGQLLPPSLPVAAPAITLEAWGYTTTPSGSNMGIITAEIYFGGEYIWERRDDLPTTFRLTYHNGTAVLTFSVTVPQAPTLGAWVHMAVSASVAMGVQFYVQGVPIGTAQALAAMGGPGGGPLALAAFHDDPRSWIGSLQDIAIYPRVLTATEISQHYALRLTPDRVIGPPRPFANALGRTISLGALVVSPGTTGALGPLTPLAQLPIRVDDTGAVVVTSVVSTGFYTQRTALANLLGRVDANGALVVTPIASAGNPTAVTPLANIQGRTDGNGALLVANMTPTGGVTPLTPLANLQGRTDVNGALLVSGLP